MKTFLLSALLLVCSVAVAAAATCDDTVCDDRGKSKNEASQSLTWFGDRGFIPKRARQSGTADMPQQQSLVEKGIRFLFGTSYKKSDN